MKINKFFTASALAAFLVLGSCSDDDYADRFDKLEQQLQDVISQVEGAAELSTAIAALEAQITTLKDAVSELPDGDALTGGLSSLESQITALEAEMAALAETGATSEELAALVAGLTSDLDLLKGDLSELLENSNVLTGDLVIFDQNSLDAALTLGDRVAIVNGWVQILADDLDAEALNAVTSKIVAVTASMYVQTDKELDFSNLESVGDILGVVGNEVDLSGLKSVGDNLEISWDGDYDFPGLTLVGNTISLGVEGDEPSFGKSAITGKATSRIINFRNVKAAEVQVLYGAYMELDSGVYDMYTDWDYSSAELFFPNATSVVFGDVPVYNLWAGTAENIELHYEGILDDQDLIVVSSASSITIKASAMVDGEIAIYALGDTDTFDEYFEKLWDEVWDTDTDWFTIPTAWDSQINLPNLASFNEDTEDTWHLFFVSHSLRAPLLVAAEEHVDDLFLTQETVALPNVGANYFYTIGNVDVELASIEDIYAQDESDLESLKLTAMENDLRPNDSGELLDEDYTWSNLTSLTIIGYTVDIMDEDAIYVRLDDYDEYKDASQVLPALETLVLGGMIDDANVADMDELTTLTTSGNINDLDIDNNDALVTVTLGHVHIAGLDGAELRVDDNDALESLVTDNLDYLKYVSVAGNGSLTSLNLSSWKSLLVDFDGSGDDDQVQIYIYNNDLSGERTRYVAGSGTTAEQPELVKSADLYSLKNIIDALEAYATANEYGGIKALEDEFYIEFMIDNVDITTTETVEDNSLSGSSDDSFDYTWTETQDIISIVPILD